METWLYIKLNGSVYFSTQAVLSDDAMLARFSYILLQRTKYATFDALYSYPHSSPWHRQDDTVNPYFARPNWIDAVWTFDLNLDALLLDRKDSHRQMALCLMRNRPVSVDDFKPYQPPNPHRALIPYAVPLLLNPQQIAFRGTCPKLCPVPTGRRKALAGKILADFLFQWRHVISGPYNHVTFYRLVTAIFRIATMRFSVREHTTKPQHLDPILAAPRNVPEWQIFSACIVPAGGTSVVICRNVEHALSLIRQNYPSALLNTEQSSLTSSDGENRIYTILSVEDIMLYQINSASEGFIVSESLFNSRTGLSEEGLELLLQAVHSHMPRKIHIMPIEHHEAILSAMSKEAIERARVGCVLD
ncbi:hypothetical protein F5Y12DRAFT_581420 [Xylaria sp. FL1777]|nr:hypothetical protein F5Y12DRAFT_581420 [Xylaria sp. FL1777]